MNVIPMRIPPSSRIMTDQDVLGDVATALEEQGFVKSTYRRAVMKREEAYPTGLSVPSGVNVAIPHTEAAHVRREGIAVAVLERAVNFRLIADPRRSVPVQLVLMLAVVDRDGQVRTLRDLMELLRRADFIERIMAERDMRAVKTFVESSFSSGRTNELKEASDV